MESFDPQIQNDPIQLSDEEKEDVILHTKADYHTLIPEEKKIFPNARLFYGGMDDDFDNTSIIVKKPRRAVSMRTRVISVL